LVVVEGKTPPEKTYALKYALIAFFYRASHLKGTMIMGFFS